MSELQLVRAFNSAAEKSTTLADEAMCALRLAVDPGDATQGKDKKEETQDKKEETQEKKQETQEKEEEEAKEEGK
ncbi:MAG: hypothetical protein GY772_27005 [bacterium]|nr:hypothetical protein [bacterium]